MIAAAERIERTCSRCGHLFPSICRGTVCPGCVIPQKRVKALPGQELTFREKQIATLVSTGMDYKDIAWELRMAHGSISAYLNGIFKKTGTRNRTELAMYWARWLECTAS